MRKGEPDKARHLGITGRGLGKKGQGGGGDRRQLVAGAAAHGRPGAGQLAQQRRSSTDDSQDLVGDPQVGEPPHGSFITRHPLPGTEMHPRMVHHRKEESR
jgi:hypothetical protein